MEIVIQFFNNSLINAGHLSTYMHNEMISSSHCLHTYIFKRNDNANHKSQK